MKAEIWVRGSNLGQLPSERLDEICGHINGPVVAVLDDNGGIKVLQPIDPQTGEAWQSEQDALEFAHRYMSPPPDSGTTEDAIIT